MIDIGKILKRAWYILWNYRVLWIFGILLVIAGASGGGNGGGNSGSGYQFSGSDNNNYNPNYPSNYQPGPEMRALAEWIEKNVVPMFEYPLQHLATWIWIGVALLLFILVLSVIFAFVRYVSEASVLRMVDEYEQTGTKVGFKAGWKLGWTRRAFIMWWIDFLLGLPVVLFLALLAGLGVLVYFSVENPSAGLAVGGTITAIGCAFLFMMLFILGMVFLGLLRQFFVRAAVLEGLGTRAAFRQGWLTFKRNWKSAALMWLVMLGLGIGFGIASIIVFFLLIPVYVILAIPGAIVAAIPGLIAFGITSLFSSGVLAWIIGILIAIPFFFTVVFAPLTLISAWYLIYESSVWTLSYREMKALEGLKPEENPVPVLPA